MSETFNERRVGERRGKDVSSNQRLNEFIAGFWTRYFRDRPEKDRRKQTDRRGSPKSSPNFLASAWKKLRSWMGATEVI